MGVGQAVAVSAAHVADKDPVVLGQQFPGPTQRHATDDNLTTIEIDPEREPC